MVRLRGQAERCGAAVGRRSDAAGDGQTRHRDWTEDAADRGLALPIYPGLDETALDTVAGALADCLAASTGGV